MRGLRRNWLVLATGLAAALPVVVSTIKAVAAGWLPVGDRAVIGIRAFDVLSTHPPLLGQYSAASQVIGEPVLSPGPLLYWLLALPVRLGSVAPAVTVGLVNVCAVVGVVALARRRGGLPLMFGTAAAVALMCASLDAWIFHDIWNPSAAVLPFTLLIFLAWSLACGEYRLLPLTALVASFVVQAQLTYALPSLALVAVAIGFLAASRAAIPRRWLVVTLAVVGVGWALPAAEEVVHRPGNVERIVDVATSGEPTLGAAAGWHSVVRAVGVAPWWLESPRGAFARVAEVNYRPPASAILTAALMVAALVAIAVAGLRSGRRELAAAAMMALGMLLALGLVAAGTPSGGILFGVVGYTLWWASPAGMFCWLVVGLGVAGLLRRRGWATAPRSVSVAALAAVAAIGAVVAGGGGRDRFEPAFDRFHSIVDAVRSRVPAGGSVVIEGPRTEIGTELKGALAYALRDRGARFLSADPPGIGTRYDPALHPHDASLEVEEGAAPGSGRVIAREVIEGVPPDAPPAARAPRTVVVRLAP
jgi:hypothetical protein